VIRDEQEGFLDVMYLIEPLLVNFLSFILQQQARAEWLLVCSVMRARFSAVLLVVVHASDSTQRGLMTTNYPAESFQLWSPIC